ncbi:MAG: PAS domain S-box protein [Chloroflexi bacterium]|nr:PAS domain S-box protein [Chloroflexota bacterium]
MVSKKTRKPRPAPHSDSAGESQFRSLIETALDVVAVLNNDGTIRYVSPSVRRITGYSPEELIGENAFAYMHEDDAREQFEVFSAIVSDPSVATSGQLHSFRFRHKEGHWVVLESVSTKLPEGPEPEGIVVNARDITDRIQARDSLRETAEQERRLSQEHEVIAEVGRVIGSTLNVEEVFELFAAEVKRLISFDMIAASLVNHSQQTTTIRYWSGPAEFREKIQTTVPLSGSVTGEVVASGKPVIVQGMSQKWIRQNFIHLSDSHRGGVLSWLGVPMVNRGETIGALLLFSSESQAFSDLDIALADRVSYQIAGAISNAGLFEELKEAEKELAGSVIERSQVASQSEVIAEIGRIISSSLNIEEVFELFAAEVSRLINFDMIAASVVDHPRQTTTIRYWSGPSEYRGNFQIAVPLNGTVTGEVVASGKPVLVQGTSNEEFRKRFIHLSDDHLGRVLSWLGIPMVNRGEMIGALLLFSSQPWAFSDLDVVLAGRVSHQIAGAIDNAGLFDGLKSAEADLAASNDRTQKILETAHDAFVGMDETGQVVAWNSQAEMTFGWPANEAVGRMLADLIMPDRFVAEHAAGLSHYLATEQGPLINKRIEMVAKHRDGREFPVELTISPLRLGDRYLFNAFIRDITGRRESEEALKRSEERFRAVYNNAPNGMGTHTLDGIPIDLNPAFLNMVGYTMDEIRDLESGVLYDTKYVEIEKELFDRALQGEDIPPYEKEYIRKDGTTVFTEVRASLERDEEGNPIGIVAVMTDITERRLLEQEIAQYTRTLEIANEDLQQLDRLKDEFISTVSHELRTPLTSIKGSAEILLTYDDEDRETQMEFLRIINKECDRLTRLVTDVLDLSRMESRQMSWFWEEAELPEIVAAAVDGTQSLLMQKDLYIKVDLDPDLPRLWNDRDRLVQVVTNLLSNSIKFTSKGGRIWINAKKLAADESDGLGEKLEICVSDTGIGIPASEYENIFQKFTQVGEKLSDKPTGTGLGLPICREIVEFFGGTIWVKSTPGKGSSFFFTVPVTAEEKKREPEPKIKL